MPERDEAIGGGWDEVHRHELFSTLAQNNCNGSDSFLISESRYQDVSTNDRACHLKLPMRTTFFGPSIMKREAPGSVFPIGCDFLGSPRDTTLPRVVGVNAAMQHLEIQIVSDFLLELVASILSSEFGDKLLDFIKQVLFVKFFIIYPLLLLLAGLASGTFLGRLGNAARLLAS